MNEELINKVREKSEQWLDSNITEEEKRAIRDMIENDEDKLVDSFYQDLKFGTGGMRGEMGIGSNRMNIYTVGMATQGLANYLLKAFGERKEISVIIAHDSRNNSRLFAETTANVFTANNIIVYLFDELRPTPELSFAIREKKAQAGVVITASHNPKEYNGYKVYWEDGGQIISPHDKNIIHEVQKIKSINDINFNGDPDKIKIISEDIDKKYIDKVASLSLSPKAIKKQKDIGIVYTPIHGTGVKLVPAALKKLGFKNIYNVPEQDVPDGNFPTVKSPNPEESAALDMAIQKARDVEAEIVMATDPDSDRVGIAVKDINNEYLLLNGNQIASVLINYLLKKWKEKGKLKGNEYIVKTIVTTELLADIADKYGVKIYNVLTGFKYIADIIKRFEGRLTFIGGGEESYGYLVGDFVRDKDAVISCAMIAEIAAWAKEKNKTFIDLLTDLYLEHGLYKEMLFSVIRKGQKGAEEIQEIMDKLRNVPPQTLGGSEVVLIHDYQKMKTFDMLSHLRYDIELPQSNVLQFITKDGSKISVRPSGTEPKIKFYLSVKTSSDDINTLEEKNKLLDKKIRDIKEKLNITSS